MTKTTPFELAQKAAAEGRLITPAVSNGTKQLDYFGFQLATHKYALSILAVGMTLRGVKLKDLKAYYGLKGKTAKDCLPEFEAIHKAYKEKIGIPTN